MKKTFFVVIVVLLSLSLISCRMLILSGDEHVAKGLELYNGEQYVKAIEEFDKAIELGVSIFNIEEVYTYTGNAYDELEKYDESIIQHKKALDINKDYYEAWVNLGVTYRHKGNFEEAEKCYFEANRINPDYAELHASLCALYIYKNEPEKAVIEFKKAIELDASCVVAYGNGALAYAMIGDFEEAKKVLKQSRTLGYKNADIIESRINVLEENVSKNSEE